MSMWRSCCKRYHPWLNEINIYNLLTQILFNVLLVIFLVQSYILGLVYAVGGFNGSLRVKTVDEYDPNLDTWTSIASMEARRSTLGVAVLNHRIYAVGGFDGSTGLNTAEVLDLSSIVPTQNSGTAILVTLR